MFGKAPDDPYFEEMDEWTWIWLYQSWLQDQEDEFNKYKEFSLFIGSFSNPEMAQAISKRDNPDFQVSDEDFEKSVKALEEIDNMIEVKQKVENSRRRRRKVIQQ